MFIGALQKLTLTDFPGKVACIVFLVNCNFRCVYCYNKELLSYKNFKKNKRALFEEKDFFVFLEKNKKMLDGVVITGGEPTMSPGIIPFMEKIKARGYKIKLDSNGTKPEVLEKAFSKNLVDYVAMDVKAPLEKYPQITASKISSQKIVESINLIKKSKIPHEFRTTLYPKLSVEDIVQVAELVHGEKLFLQNFQPKKALNVSSRRLKPMRSKEIKEILSKTKGIADVELRE